MGCGVLGKKKSDNQNPRFQAILSYPHQIQTQVTKYKSTGEFQSKQSLTFTLPRPVILKARKILLKQKLFQISSCCLPGLDPKGHFEKPCQDFCQFNTQEKSLILQLYDGHGQDGLKIAQTCCQQIQNFLKSTSTVKLTQTPSQNLLPQAIQQAKQRIIQNSSQIDIMKSGTQFLNRSLTIIRITDNKLSIASLGTSRAIIATLKPPLIANMHQQAKQEKLRSIQLTTEQKVSEDQELQRIKQQGGKVSKVKSVQGDLIGPYRIWKPNQNAPGLISARSIGFFQYQQIGVSCTPICRQYQIDPEFDQFIVLVSDGITQVMENSDIINFVQHYRRMAKTDIVNPLQEASIQNSCIAQLLCEQARKKWITIVQKENVFIDDISCIVLELKRIAQSNTSFQPLDSGSEFDSLRRAPTINHVKTRDPRRGSFAAEIPYYEDDQAPQLDAVALQDPRRSSVVFQHRRV